METATTTGRARSRWIPIGDTWRRVSEAYDGHPEPFLLYWRGVLAQCLSQEDRAAADLSEFVAWYDQGGEDTRRVYLDPFRDARNRLRRLGQSREPVSRSSPRVLIGLGGGYGNAGEWSYGAAAIDLSVRLIGVLRFEAFVRPSVGQAGPLLGDGSRWVPVLVPFGVGAGLRFEGPVSPRLGLGFQAAIDRRGDAAPTFLPGALLWGGLEIPLGTSPVALRPSGEVGLLGLNPIARGLLSVVIAAG